MAQAVRLMRDLSRSPEFLHLETMREMSRLDEGQRLSNAKEAGIAIGLELRQPEIDALNAEIAELRRKLGER